MIKVIIDQKDRRTRIFRVRLFGLTVLKFTVVKYYSGWVPFKELPIDWDKIKAEFKKCADDLAEIKKKVKEKHIGTL